jgi:hypothetical protein
MTDRAPLRPPPRKLLLLRRLLLLLLLVVQLAASRAAAPLPDDQAPPPHGEHQWQIGQDKQRRRQELHVDQQEQQRQRHALLSARLGSKTPYLWRAQLCAGGAAPEPGPGPGPGGACPAPGEQQPPPGECRALHLFAVFRHGARFPTRKHISRMREAAQVLGESALQVPFRDEQAGLLTRRGERELFELGRRARARFPELFRGLYHPLRYDVRSSQVTRALQSASAFAHGLFHGARARAGEEAGEGGQREGQEEDWSSQYEHVALVADSARSDRLLRFHKTCPRYASEVKKGARGAAALERAAGAAASASVLARLLARGDADAAADAGALAAAARWAALEPEAAGKLARSAWDGCVTTLSVWNRTQPACELFDEEAIEALALAEDAASHWDKGHGFSVTGEMACVLAGEMIEATLSAVQGADRDGDGDVDSHDAAAEAEDATSDVLLDDDGPRGPRGPRGALRRMATLRFAHAETVLPLLARLGLFADPRGDTPYSAHASPSGARSWRTSSVSPFAANVALVLHACGARGELMVQLVYNEQPVSLPSRLCGGAAAAPDYLCPLASFRAASASLLGCDFDRVCGNREREEQQLNEDES